MTGSYGSAGLLLPELGVLLHHWHGGQGCILYAVGSTFYLGDETTPHDVDAALWACRRLLLQQPVKDEDRTELRDIISALGEWLEENPHDANVCPDCADNE